MPMPSLYDVSKKEKWDVSQLLNEMKIKVSDNMAGNQELSQEEITYLHKLAFDTWQCIGTMVNERTGLPYDTTKPGVKRTSVSNIGVYAASIVGACEMGFIDRSKAFERLTKLLDNLEKFKHWRGFCQSWNHVETCGPISDDPWISVLDSGNLAGGLLVVNNAFPELSPRVTRYLTSMDWSAFYNPKTHDLYGGYDMANHVLNKEWKLNLLGSDSRIASYIAIGLGKVKPAHWKTLLRDQEKRYGLSYLVPGWQGGGLFMQFISSLFVNDHGTEMGLSAARFAYAQIFHAKVIQSPVWGWSASDTPSDGYLGWQALKDSIVTPHATSLPLSYFPKQCIENFKNLEKYGARKPGIVSEKRGNFGFRDALDLKTGKVTETYLMLDQSMLFLSLVNFLKDGVLSGYVGRDPISKKACRLISDYKNRNLGSFWKKIRHIKVQEPSISISSVSKFISFKSRKSLKIPAHFLSDKAVSGRYQMLWRLFENKTKKYVKKGSVSLAFPLKKDVHELVFNLSQRNYLLQVAIIKNKRLISEDHLHVVPKSGSISLEMSQPPSWNDYLQKWAKKDISLKGNWQSQGDRNAEVKKIPLKGQNLKWSYSFNSGQWVRESFELSKNFSKLKRLTFQYKCSGTPVSLQVKLEDQRGTSFGYDEKIAPNKDWAFLHVDMDRLRYLSGGGFRLDFRKINQLTITLSGPKKARGTFEFKAIKGFY